MRSQSIDVNLEEFIGTLLESLGFLMGPQRSVWNIGIIGVLRFSLLLVLLVDDVVDAAAIVGQWSLNIICFTSLGLIGLIALSIINPIIFFG